MRELACDPTPTRFQFVLSHIINLTACRATRVIPATSFSLGLFVRFSVATEHIVERDDATIGVLRGDLKAARIRIAELEQAAADAAVTQRLALAAGDAVAPLAPSGKRSEHVRAQAKEAGLGALESNASCAVNQHQPMPPTCSNQRMRLPWRGRATTTETRPTGKPGEWPSCRRHSPCLRRASAPSLRPPPVRGYDTTGMRMHTA